MPFLSTGEVDAFEMIYFIFDDTSSMFDVFVSSIIS
jgi:hypothetical protein